MIHRREFVQSMIALGAATTFRRADVLCAAPNQAMKDLADAALSTAKAAGASYADIRINRYRNQFLFTRDRRVQNIVNTEDFGFGVRVLVDNTWGFASSSAVTKDDIAAMTKLPQTTLDATLTRMVKKELIHRKPGNGAAVRGRYGQGPAPE